MGRCKLDCPDSETECCICCTKQDSEQLKNMSTLARPVGWSKAYEIIMLKDAIEIVKGGRV